MDSKSDTMSNQQSQVRSVPLVERMDKELGEATSGIGTILAEFVRRTLRTGIQKVDEELQDRVDEKVDASITGHMPVIEETAREVAGQRVEVLETEFQSTVQRIDSDIEQTERRTDENARRVIEEQLESLKTRSKSTADELRDAVGKVQQLLEDERQRREAAEQNLTNALQQGLQKAGTLMQQQSEALQQKLQQQIILQREQLDRAEARIAELEKPRGLAKLFGKLGGKKKAQAEPAEFDEE